MGRRYASQKKARNGEDELGMEGVAGRACFPGALWAEAAGERPAAWTGKGGPGAPCRGRGKDRTKDTARGGHGWHKKALLSLKRGLYSILFAG